MISQNFEKRPLVQVINLNNLCIRLQLKFYLDSETRQKLALLPNEVQDESIMGKFKYQKFQNFTSIIF